MADQQTNSVDAVIGLIPRSRDARAVESSVTRVLQSALPGRIALVHPPYTPSQTHPLDSHPQWQLIESSQLAQDPASLAQSPGDGFHAVFDITRKLGARACAVVVSDLASTSVDWISLLLEPVLQEQFDLVTPCYARHPFEGMINRAIIYPLVRALYGMRIRNPMGPDFGISSRLLGRLSNSPRARLHALPSLVAETVTNGLNICEAHLGIRTFAPPDWANLSSLLAQVLGPLFFDVERYAAHWQRARGSQPIREFGQLMYVAGPESAVDVTRLIESFQLGARNLLEVWGLMIPPSTLLELRNLARGSPANFRMPDATWAQVVYDFALAHRLRTISRDQMLRALTPIYLGWLASYARELEHSSPELEEQRLERLCVAFEETKSYFVSRWRWPDRFNP